MSDDQNTDEITELRARLATLEPADAPAKKVKRNRLRSGFVAFGLFALAIGVVQTIRLVTPAPAQGPDLIQAPTVCDAAWAAKVRKAAIQSGIARGGELQGLDFIVLVSPDGWNRLGLATQKAIGLATACQLDAFASATVHFRYDAAGPDTLTLSNSDLYRLGLQRFVPTPTKPPPPGFRALVWGAAPSAGLQPMSDGIRWAGAANSPASYLGVAPAAEDYVFEHKRLTGGDLAFKGAPTYALLKAALQTAYGAPSSADIDDTTDSYAWSWTAQKIQLRLTFKRAEASANLHFVKVG